MFDLSVPLLLPATFHIYGNITLIRLGFLKVVFSGGRANLTPFIFQEEVIQYQYYCIQLQQLSLSLSLSHSHSRKGQIDPPPDFLGLMRGKIGCPRHLKFLENP